MIENFDKLLLERKIDVLVAIHVLNWEDISVLDEGRTVLGTFIDEEDPVFSGILQNSGRTQIKHYSTNYEWSLVVIRRFSRMELIRNKYNNNTELWHCRLGEIDNLQEYAVSSTAQLAICYAGLKAVRFDVDRFLQEEINKVKGEV